MTRVLHLTSLNVLVRQISAKQLHSARKCAPVSSESKELRKAAGLRVL